MTLLPDSCSHTFLGKGVLHWALAVRSNSLRHGSLRLVYQSLLWLSHLLQDGKQWDNQANLEGQPVSNINRYKFAYESGSLYLNRFTIYPAAVWYKQV